MRATDPRPLSLPEILKAGCFELRRHRAYSTKNNWQMDMARLKSIGSKKTQSMESGGEKQKRQVHQDVYREVGNARRS